jgi:hypothetical protein
MNKLREAVAESLTLYILVVSLATILKRIEFRMKVTLPAASRRGRELVGPARCRAYCSGGVTEEEEYNLKR